MKLMDIPIGLRLTGTFLMIVGLFLGFGALQIQNFATISAGVHENAARALDADKVKDMRIDFKGIYISVADSIIKGDPNLLESKIAEFTAQMNAVAETLGGKEKTLDRADEEKQRRSSYRITGDTWIRSPVRCFRLS